MSERDMRRNVMRRLRELDAKPVENPVWPGTPDVNYVEGWIELKWARAWPVNGNTSPVLIHHYTPQQRVWLARRWKAGGNSCLLLQVGKEWLLFTGEVAAVHVGRATRVELERLAVRHWRNGLITEELISCLNNLRTQNAF